MRICLTVMVVLLAVSLSAGGFAATYYVAPGGSDSNPGTQAAPWATLQKAADTMVAGDTTLVESGAYAGFRAETVGTAAAPITLKADAGASVKVNAPGPNNKHSSNIEIENYNLTVQYWVVEGIESSNSPKYGFDTRGADHITIRNCYAHNNTSTGIFFAFANYDLVEGCESAANGEHGIYHSNSGDYPTIRGNNLHDNYACGLHMNGDITMGGDGTISYATVEQNTIWGNGNPGGGSAINCDGVSDSIFRNNLVYNNYASGISLYAGDGAAGSSRNKVYNNTFYFGPAFPGRHVVNIPKSAKGKPNPTGNQIFNNILYTANTTKCSIFVYGAAALAGSDYNACVNRFSIDGRRTITLSQWQGYGFDANSFTAEPSQLFVDAAGLDFHLSSGSPAANKGTTLADVTNDHDGKTRVAPYDIGCYEDW